jgi:hypothetical protein
MEVAGLWAQSEKRKGVEGALFEIYNEAVRFSQFLRRQRACWSIRFPQRQVVPATGAEGLIEAPLRFDPASMKDEWWEDEGVDAETLRQKYVELVITPVLYKRGNLDGDHFDIECPAERAWVSMCVRPAPDDSQNCTSE